MIVVSGALVVLSIILLVTGLTARDDLVLIYVSIGSSILAGVFLILGALQRREDKPAAGTGAAQPDAGSPFERVTTVSVTTPRAVAASSAGSGGGPVVSVVPGRPRFHTSDCRFLAGRPDVETIPSDDAAAQGYSECGVCKPSESLVPASAGRSAATMTDDDVADQATEAMEVDLAEAAPAARRSTARTATAPAKSARRPAKTPARAATKTATRTGASAAKPAARAAKAAAPAAKPAARATKAATAAKPAARAAQPAKPAKAAKAAKPAKAAAGTVVVIPDRDKFHSDDCRFVRDVAGTLAISKATARRQGYVACGVCKP